MLEASSPTLLQQRQQVSAVARSVLAAASSSSGNEAARAVALASLRSLFHPSRSALFLRQSSLDLAQAFEQLLLDEAYIVKQALAITYGALGAMSAGFDIPDGEKPGGTAECFMEWALPRLSDSTSNIEATGMALAGLREFLASGDVKDIEKFVPSILKSCQDLLENEMAIWEPLLGVLTVCGVRFCHDLEPYFNDMVDLLLGWALDPEHPEGDRRLIVDNFLKFSRMWARNPQFSVNLLRKFLDDMEVFAYDHSTPSLKHLQRLLALASCFVAVMQATASGMDEADPYKHQLSAADVNLPSECVHYMGKVTSSVGAWKEMLPRLLSCFKIFSEKFCTFRWLNEACRCLSLFAEVLKENFAEFYDSALEILFPVSDNNVGNWQQSAFLGLTSALASSSLSAPQVQLILQVNMRLIACQGLKLSAKAMSKLLEWSSTFALLRFHPCRIVRGIVAATYNLLLHHDSIEVATLARNCVMKDAEFLLERKFTSYKDGARTEEALKMEAEVQGLDALFRFDLMLLFNKFMLKDAPALSPLKASQAEHAFGIPDLFLVQLNLYEGPLQWNPRLQLVLLQVLHSRGVCGSNLAIMHLEARAEGFKDIRVAQVEEQEVSRQAWKDSEASSVNRVAGFSLVTALAMDSHASILMKLEALSLARECAILNYPAQSGARSQQTAHVRNELTSQLITRLPGMLLTMAFDKELRVRAVVALVLQAITRSNFVRPLHYQPVTMVAVKQLKDPESSLRASFQRVTQAYAPAALWIYGWSMPFKSRQAFLSDIRQPDRSHMLNWKRTASDLHSVQHLRTYQLSWFLNFLSQRSQVLPLHWLQRMVCNFPAKVKLLGGDPEGAEQEVTSDERMQVSDGLAGDSTFLEQLTSNTLSALWWTLQLASRHCVTVRLRTHLGGPSQTFATLERMLLDIPHLCRIDFGPRAVVTGEFGSPTTVQLLPLRLLIEFVEALKKDIYNSYEGCVMLTPPPSLSVLFFRANRKVCEDWFVRIREAFISASVATQCHSGTILNAALYLQDLRTTIPPSLRESRGQVPSENIRSVRNNIQVDLAKAVQQISLALCRSHEADALQGLKVWVKSAFASVVVEDYLSSSKTSTSLGPFVWLEGLALQANGQYEKALAHYNYILQLDEALAAMGADEIHFMIARTVECYKALADWGSLDQWVQELQRLRANHAGKTYCGALTTSGIDMNAVFALARFDGGDTHGALGYLDLTPQSRSELTADPWHSLHRSEQMLLQVMLQRSTNTDKVASEIALAKAMVEDCSQVVMLDGLAQAIPYLMQLVCIQVYECFRDNNNPEERLSKVLLSFTSQVTGPLDHVHQDTQAWLKLLRVYHVVCPGSYRTLQLHQQLVRLSRKQLNRRLARRLLDKALELPVSADFGLDASAEPPSLTARLLYEDTLLLHAEEKQDEALGRLWQMVEDKISACLEHPVSKQLSDPTYGKACLKLASWLQGSLTPSSMLTVAAKLGIMLFSNEADLPVSDKKNLSSLQSKEILLNGKFNTTIQQIAGAAIKGATICSRHLAKAWFNYGYWCFNYAEGAYNPEGIVTKSSCNILNLIDGEMRSYSSELTFQEVASIRLIVSRIVIGPSRENRNQSIAECGNAVDECVKKVVSAFIAAARCAGSEDMEGEPSIYVLSLRLQQLLLELSSAWSVATAIPELMRIWWDLRCRKISLFSYSARGFMQFLSLSNQRLSKGATEIKPYREDCMVSASLYVLQIFVNYGVELEDSLQQGLLFVPPSSWQGISAQILARLSSHPESRIRRQLKGLLMASAKLSPWAIVYLLLVDMNGCEVLSEELKDLRDCLSQFHPLLARDVKSMIAELSAITVFWDELWLSTLQDLRTDVMRRITTLKHETARVAGNATLSRNEKVRINAAKYLAMMAPVIVSLDRRLSSTSRPPENPREDWFQDKFGNLLRREIEVFKAPPVGAASLSGVWRPFDVITADLVRYQKKSTVSLSYVSPNLTALQSSEAPMPGLGFHSSIVDRTSWTISKEEESMVTLCKLSDMITVSSFGSHVTVLSTKTKPKKLQIVGSDGTAYPYLLKGREDLRLDARIMQLLQAVNFMLQTQCETRRRALTVRYYSVTPINGLAGLIQWIDDLTSIYSLYKAWQERSVVVSGSSLTDVVPSVPRPSDLYYGKIIPALKEKGLRKVLSRREWPQDVKRNVLLELVKETPRQLLQKELWCSSEGLSSCRAKLDRFSASVAVTSILGYILGLGDRHLDNILVDFCSGHVVHIDYNVCFDKGLRLKIPEIVPFRLTHTIQAALGLTGVEGVFRKNCEAVLQVLQCNKNVLLMLLQVFIWDPLVEWMRGDGHDEAVIGGEERKGMELAVNLSLFASRLQEIRVPLQVHHDRFLLTLPAAVVALENLVRADCRLEHAMALYSQAEQKRRAAIYAEGAAMSLLIEATSDHDKSQDVFRAQAQELEKTKLLIIEAARKLISWVKQHASVLEALRAGSIPEFESCAQAELSCGTLSLSAAVSAAGAPLAIIPEAVQTHFQEIDREVALLTASRKEALLTAVQSMKAYSLVLHQLVPINYVASSYVHSWAEVFQVLSQNLSSDVLVVAKRRAADLIAQCHGLQDESVRQKYKEVRLRYERSYRDLQKLQGDLSDLEAVANPETLRKSKDRLFTTITGHLQYLARDYGTESEEKQSKFLRVLHQSATTLYDENWDALKMLQYRFWKHSGASGSLEEDQTNQWLVGLRVILDKWMLLADHVVEVGNLGLKSGESSTFGVSASLSSLTSRAREWGVRFSACVSAVGEFSQHMTGSVLPDFLSAVFSHDASIMEAFTAFTHILEDVDKIVELNIVSSVHRSRDYDGPGVDKARGSDNSSWEDIDYSRACFPGRKEMPFEEIVQRFNVLVDLNIDSDLLNKRGKVLIAAFAQVFSRLEILDQGLGSLLRELRDENDNLLDEMHLDLTEEPENVWKNSLLSQEKAFFLWKIRFIAGLLDASMSTFQNPSENAQQLEMRLRGRLLWFLGQYIGHRLMSMLLLLVKETHPMMTIPVENEIPEGDWHAEEIAGQALQLLREYCYTCDSVKTANATAASLRFQREDLLQTLDKVHLEAAQLEWLNDMVLSKLLPQNQPVGVPRSMRGDKQSDDILWWDRKQLRKNLFSASTAIRQATEGLQGREVAGAAAEGELERALLSTWTPGTATLSNAEHSTEISPKFYDYLHRRRELLRSNHEHAVNILRLCESVLDFEASRDGCLSISPGDGLQSMKERGRMWQQTYFELVSRLESAYFASLRLQTEWQSAVVHLESARVDLSKVANELQSASSESGSVLGDVKVSIVNLQAWLKESATRWSAVSNIRTRHSALTSDVGQMLDEVLAITEGMEGAEDVYGLAQEAAAEHACLMAKLSEVNELFLPLEPLLTSDTLLSSRLARLSSSGIMLTDDLILTEEISGSGHNADLSHSSLNDISTAFSETTSSLVNAVKNLHSCLSKLNRTASLDAGFLHKALAGVGDENQGKQSLQVTIGESDTHEQFDLSGKDIARSGRDVESTLVLEDDFSDLQVLDDLWISPPDRRQFVTSTHFLTTGSSPETSEEEKVSQNGERHQTLLGTMRDVSTFVYGSYVGDDTLDLSSPPVPCAPKTHIRSQRIISNSYIVKEPLLFAIDNKLEHQHEADASLGDLHRLVQSKEFKKIGLDSAPRAQSFRGKNAHAVSVLKRVQMKLEGFDIDGNRKQGVSEQVDILIRQATGCDNLANMYEGWTPWV